MGCRHGKYMSQMKRNIETKAIISLMKPQRNMHAIFQWNISLENTGCLERRE